MLDYLASGKALITPNFTVLSSKISKSTDQGGARLSIGANSLSQAAGSVPASLLRSASFGRTKNG
jgi:hypothetical protein